MELEKLKNGGLFYQNIDDKIKVSDFKNYQIQNDEWGISRFNILSETLNSLSKHIRVYQILNTQSIRYLERKELYKIKKVIKALL